ncbi:hypothetical protein [Sphingobacterium sp. LRF_L2]|uniref:hypothetical protein n=1 Tax=Sphingobacterium sp. LRF_L2 TaxID=3369421 RepID=UPI003F62ED8A
MLILGLRIYKLDCPSYQNPATGFYKVVGQQTDGMQKWHFTINGAASSALIPVCFL